MVLRITIEFYSKGRKRIMPTPERKREIEKEVTEIINKYSLNRPGFDLTSFLRQKEQFEIGLQDIADDDTTGLLLVNERDTVANTHTHRLIIINSRLEFQPDYLQRRRFIIAHEYGHFKMHMNGEEIYAHRDYSTRKAPKEREADFFARCLLMPRELVNSALSPTVVGSSNLKEKIALIARTFNVTEKKARQRLLEDLSYK